MVMTRMNLVFQYLRFQLFRGNCMVRFGCYVAAYREWFFREWFFHSTLALLRWKSCRRRRSLSRWSAPCKFRRNCDDARLTLIFLPPRPFLIKCSEQTFVISVSLNFVPTSLRIFCSHWALRFGSFGKFKKPTLFPLASTVPLWL